MDTTDIKELIAIMDEAGLTALRVAHDGDEIELERKPALGGSSGLIPGLASRVEQLLSDKAHSHDAAAVVEAEQDGATIVRSPMVGMFYLRPSPDEEPFVKVGQEVITGQTMALVEAMKVMNEITASVSGTVVEVLAANDTQVEYDQPLFRIATD